VVSPVGEGLVRSVDYFGERGDRPTHPELLDFLATQLRDQGWSMKRLIREIVLSPNVPACEHSR